MKYLGAEILFGCLGKPHILLADSHVLPQAKRRFRKSKAPSSGLRPLAYRELVRIGHSRGRHSSRRVNCVTVGREKFRENVDMSVGIFICKIFVESIYDRTFLVGVSTHL